MSGGTGIEGFRNDSAFARLVAARLRTERFELIDIGCAGGLAPGWHAFGERLSALCIDADEEEIARLTARETSPNVRYVSGFVGVPHSHPLKARIGSAHCITRFGQGRVASDRHELLREAREKGQDAPSVADYLRRLARELRGTPLAEAPLDYVEDFAVIPPTATDIEAAQRHQPGDSIYLSAFVRSAGFEDFDFLKLDIDGPDYEVLRSAGDLLERPSLLGAAVEVCFMGSHGSNDHTFHNVDRLMRQKGFDLFGLSTRAYASAALPPIYLPDKPGINLSGRPIQGDAIYMRDLSSNVRWADADAVSDEKLLKLAALFSLFNLPDQAAEILLVHEDRLAERIDMREGLDLLTSQVQEGTGQYPLCYNDYIAAFEREDPVFFNGYARREAWLARLIAADRERQDLLDRITKLEAERDAAAARLKSRARGPLAGLFRRRGHPDFA